ncbi:hypothetical protein I4U23_030425 [Adineta vaga]|nr:hypothetical protein I4U23_030425 [Adineta vaga]
MLISTWKFKSLSSWWNGWTNIFSSLYSIDLNSNPPRWNEHQSSSGPMARAAHGGVSIESTSILFIFGGLSRSGQALSDTWSWSAKNEQ